VHTVAVVPFALADRLALQGPSGTPYEDGTFQLSFNIPEQYPLTSPQVKFVTKVCHSLDWGCLFFCHSCALTRAGIPASLHCRSSILTSTGRRARFV
jgi:hypothetical protein